MIAARNLPVGARSETAAAGAMGVVAQEAGKVTSKSGIASLDMLDLSVEIFVVGRASIRIEYQTEKLVQNGCSAG